MLAEDNTTKYNQVIFQCPILGLKRRLLAQPLSQQSITIVCAYRYHIIKGILVLL